MLLLLRLHFLFPLQQLGYLISFPLLLEEFCKDLRLADAMVTDKHDVV